ncbi:MAG: hypothetical protein KDA65_11285, partial [Planctomycetaceae bacterium]|nr:hypothetical protein [Planctomycetaceae bacterium]
WTPELEALANSINAAGLPVPHREFPTLRDPALWQKPWNQLSGLAEKPVEEQPDEEKPKQQEPANSTVSRTQQQDAVQKAKNAAEALLKKLTP